MTKLFLLNFQHTISNMTFYIKGDFSQCYENNVKNQVNNILPGFGLAIVNKKYFADLFIYCK